MGGTKCEKIGIYLAVSILLFIIYYFYLFNLGIHPLYFIFTMLIYVLIGWILALISDVKFTNRFTLIIGIIVTIVLFYLSGCEYVDNFAFKFFDKFIGELSLDFKSNGLPGQVLFWAQLRQLSQGLAIPFSYLFFSILKHLLWREGNK